jgi:hypothetical protein
LQGWTFADRPPLQTGVSFLFWPLNWVFDEGIYYQSIGTVLQLSWVIALGELAATLGFSTAKQRFIVGVTGFSGVIFFNSVYVWPKLFAGSLFLFCLLPLLSCLRQRRRLTDEETCFAAGSACLSLLAHSGIAFSMLALVAIIPFRLPRIISRRAAALAAGIFIVLCAPWLAYQRSVDSSNVSQLAKLHLAGDFNVDNRPLPEVIETAYRKLSFAEWRLQRYENVRTLLGRREMDALASGVARAWLDHGSTDFKSTTVHGMDPTRLSGDMRSLATVLRADQRDYVFRGLGILNVAWILLLARFVPIGGRRRRLKRGLGFLIALTALTAILWCALEFLPGSTIMAHASYAMVLLLFFIASALIWDAGRMIRNVLAALHILSNVILWGVCPPGAALSEYSRYPPTLKVIPALVAAIMTIVVIVYFFKRSSLAARGDSKVPPTRNVGLQALQS